MAFNGSGVYIPPSVPDFPAVSGETIKSSNYNVVINDIATALTKCVTRDGQSPAQTNLPMAGKKHTGVANAVAADEYMAYGQFGATLDSQLETKIEAMTRLEFNNSFLNIANNLTYVNPNWTYTANGAGSLIFLDRATGAITFYTVASGTAGNVATLIRTGTFKQNVSNFSPSVHYIENGVGAHATIFDVDANIGAAWESVGPTGSGATNIWTAMDGLLITSATYVEVRGYASAEASADTASVTLHARKNGDSTAISGRTAFAAAGISISGATVVASNHRFYGRIPLSSGKFDLYLAVVNGGVCEIYLSGYGT